MKKTLILGLILATSSSIHAYTLNAVAQSGARWKNFPVSMRLNPANSGLPSAEVQRVITNAMSSWNTGVSEEVLAISAVNNTVTASTGMDMDGINSITFSSSFREDSNGFDPDVTVAIGGQYGNDSDMVDAFIIFNSESVAWSTDRAISSNKSLYGDDLETIALHELGHVLGLGHSQINTAAMSAARTSRIVRDLAQDDIDGAKYLINSANGAATGSGNGYSSDASRSAGCGSIVNSNTGNSSGNTGGMAAMMLIPITVLVFARKRVRELN
ncbi:MAG: matrixin family metalloprotease [bacterium]